MRQILTPILLLLTFWTSPSWAAVLIDDGSGRTSTVNSVSSDVGTTGLNFRGQKKVGVGLEAAGSLGLVGVKTEINLTRIASFGGGFGLGPGYQSFNVFVKRAIGGDAFVPYVAGGFSRWYSVGDRRENISDSTPGFLAERFLSDEERRTGDFAETLIYPAAGVQYYQLSGSWAGASLYAEILFLIDLDDFASSATGGLGFMYYF